ncbi:hypothetical protein Trisim1_009742 [Trichoderma cf. simile WF8]
MGSLVNLTNISQRHVVCKVAIVGGGIGGLAAAIALRKAGHEVHVYEQSAFLSEVGAAIHITPNANSVLHHLGIDHETGGGSCLGMVRFYKHTGELLKSISVTEQRHRWQKPWLQTYRVDLHRHLKETAISNYAVGMPAQLHTSSRTVSVDAHKATVTLDDGNVIQADVIIGADGVRSVARLSVCEEKKYIADAPTQNAFRFMISIAKIQDDPATASFLDTVDSMDMYYADDRKVVMYLCEHGTSLNFVCCHPASLSGKSFSQGYDHKAAKASLLDVYQSFSPDLLAVMAKVSNEDVRIYPLLDMDTLPAFANDRLAVIGDAAHPFTPHLAQGAAQAIEDAAALGVMLSYLDSKDAIPERLRLFNKARYTRATLIQDMSRVTGNEPTRSNSSAEMEEWKVHDYLTYGFSHDEVHNSTQILREYMWAKAPRLYWRQPLGFGPMDSPRQDALSCPRPDGLSDAVSTTATVRFRTSATLLRNMFPSTAYSFAKTDTVAEASFTFQSIQNLSWLGGRGYELVMFQIHGVQHRSKDGSVRQGIYIPIVLENLADPIISGREDLGWPKLYSEIKFKNDTGVGGNLDVELSWGGVKWAFFSWGRLDANDAPQSSHTAGVNSVNSGNLTNGSGAGEEPVQSFGSSGEDALFVHKYIPATTGSPCREAADADYDVLFHSTKPKVLMSQEASAAGFQILERTNKQLPTLHHVVNRLSELPILSIVEASVKKVLGQDQFMGAKRLD